MTKGLAAKHGADRVRDTPISEQAIVGAAVGAALGGLRPVAEIMFMDFLGLCLDQLANHAAKLRYMSGGLTPVPMVLRTAVGGGLQVGAQHSQMLEAWLTHVPGLKVVVPSTPSDARGLLASCIADEDPCVFIEQVAPAVAQGCRSTTRPSPSGWPTSSDRAPTSPWSPTAVRSTTPWPWPTRWRPRASRSKCSTSAPSSPSTRRPCSSRWGATRRAVILHEAVVTGRLRRRAGGGDLRGPLRPAARPRPAGGRAAGPAALRHAASSAWRCPGPNDCSKRIEWVMAYEG